MYEIVEEFANNNQQWVIEFVAAFQKMIENGYQSDNEKGNSELTASPFWQEITYKNPDKVVLN